MKSHINRRNFVISVGAGLVTIGLPGCGVTANGRTIPDSGDDGGVATADDLAMADKADLATTGHADLAGHPDMSVAHADMAVKPKPDMTVPRDLTVGCPQTAKAVNGGQATAVASGNALHFPKADVFLCRDQGGLYALTDICTHEGCIVAYDTTNQVFNCPCHFSQFDENGAVLQGPAVSALDHYAVCIDEKGVAYIDTDTIVDPATRTT